MKKKLICLIGPTAVGKTEVAVFLAKRLDAEIISCDSMQVYKGIDIATSKPTKRQRKIVTHHLLDVTSPAEEYNAARFASSCRKIINEIHQRAKLPLIVAGTGLYLKALLDGLFPGPGQNIGLRLRFYQLAKKYGPAYLYKRLKNKDPQSAQSIHPHDLRRVIRALEVYENTGKPISELKEKTKGIRGRYVLSIFGLQRPRSQLYSRIEKRVDRMFRQGLVQEIKRLLKDKVSKTAKSLLGFKEVSSFLKGKCSYAEAKRLLKRNTRHYAKRQISWFKHEKQVQWIEIGSKDTPAHVAEKILTNVGNWKR